ncbi:MAG: glycosyltransferase, partial [Burkholderiaceae bacterium]
MKVLQVGKFYPPVRGGIETVMWELAEGLNRVGLRSDVLCANQSPVSSSERFAGGYDVMRAASLGMLLSTSVAPALVSQLASLKRRYDVLHVHMPDPMAALAVAITRPSMPMVVHWHSDVIRQRRAMKLYGHLQRWMLRRADAIVTTSHQYANSSVALQPWRHKVEVIPIGVTDRACSVGHADAALIRSRFAGRKIIFSLGRMTYYKGFEVLIEAAAHLPDCVVLIGGDGELLSHYRGLVARRGLQDRVHMLGHVNDDDLPGYFEACDVFCMTSTVRAEAYGVAMVEAMARGKPVVATDIVGSGMPWVNVDGETGFNMPTGQPMPLAATLTRLLENPMLCEQLGAAARRRYLREFDATL